MNRKIVGILVIMLLITTTILPVAGIVKVDKNQKLVKNIVADNISPNEIIGMFDPIKTVKEPVNTMKTTAESGIRGAKSLYVLSDHNADPTPIQAYDIQGSSLIYQTTYNIPETFSVGITMDEDAEILFITYEGTNIIRMVNARTMKDIGSTIAPGANNLAGIVVDHDNDKVYTVNRQTNQLFVYSWDSINKILILDPGSPHFLSPPP